MNDINKVEKMFYIVHPELKKHSYMEVVFHDEYELSSDEQIVSVYKDGNLCWGYTLTELLFEYTTREWQ